MIKIAFVDNLPVGGGLSRFSLRLCKALIENYKDLHVDYYIHESNMLQIPEIINLDPRVNVKLLYSTKKRPRALMFLNSITSRIFRFGLYSQNTIQEIEQRIGEQYELAYFPSAHMMKLPTLKIPVTGTWHDFNWRYFFGTEIFSNEFARMMNSETPKWFSKAHCITSSHFILSEAKLMYPGMFRYPDVIPIAQVVVSDKIEQKRAAEIIQELGINYPYLIFPGHFFPHKNHLNLFAAFYLLKKKPAFKDYKLILAGVSTNKVEKAKAECRGIKKILNDSEDFDIIGMGYQPNEYIDALIMNADLLVSPSIYEAICTPAMDAWSFGTPTAISDISPFREHESTWNIRSAFFDPMDPKNIADVIETYLNDPEKAKKDAQVSQMRLAEYSWEMIAKRYMEVFQKAMGQK